MTEKVLILDIDKCTGCRICELACSFKKECKFNPRLSRVHISRLDTGVNVPILCQHCEKPVCVAVCPTGAIKKDPVSGIVRINLEICNQCNRCIESCPVGAIQKHPLKNCLMKCDLCGGTPECVKECPANVLQLVVKNQTQIDRRKNILKRLAKFKKFQS